MTTQTIQIILWCLVTLNVATALLNLNAKAKLDKVRKKYEDLCVECEHQLKVMDGAVQLYEQIWIKDDPRNT